MKSKEYYKQLDEKFTKRWAKKRANKFKYVLTTTSFFAIPLSFILGISNFGMKGLVSLKFLILTLLTFLIYAGFVYFVEFKVQEKRFQKITKKTQDIDSQ